MTQRIPSQSLRRWLPSYGWILCLTAAAVSSTAQAQAEVDPEAISQFARLIRWGGVLSSLFVVGVAWIVLRFTNQLVERLSQQFADRRLALQKAETLFQFAVYIGTGSTAVLLSFRIDEKVLALIGGTAAVSVGFAVKDLVASFIAGIMIMLDRPFQVGDRVAFGGEYGDITAIGLRSVRMRTLDDNIVTIPNNKFISDITSCGNYGALDMQVSMSFFIGLDQDVALAQRLLREAALSSRYVHLPKPITVLVTQVITDNYVAIQLKVKAYVLDTKYEKAFESDVHLRALKGFRERSIQPPAVLHRHLDSSAAASTRAAS